MAEGEKLQRPRRRRDSRSNEHRTIELLALEMLSAQLGSVRAKLSLPEKSSGSKAKFLVLIW